MEVGPGEDRAERVAGCALGGGGEEAVAEVGRGGLIPGGNGMVEKGVAPTLTHVTCAF